MKKVFFYVSIITVMVFFSLTTRAQQNNAAKPPEVKGNKLQPAPDSKQPVVSAATDEKTIHNTATPVSSAGTETKLVKAVEKNPPVQLPPPTQLPQTDKLGLPKKSNN